MFFQEMDLSTSIRHLELFYTNKLMVRYRLQISIGRTVTEAEAPILWTPDSKCQLTRKDPDWERLKAIGEGGGRRIASLTQWASNLANSGDSAGQRSLASYSLWGCKELDTTWLLNNNSKLVTKTTRFEADAIWEQVLLEWEQISCSTSRSTCALNMSTFDNGHQLIVGFTSLHP